MIEVHIGDDMKIFIITLFCLNLSAYATNIRSVDSIEIKLLSMEIPARMDDHGKFGLATPDFEINIQLRCRSLLNDFVKKKVSFVIPENKTNSTVLYKYTTNELSFELDHYEVQDCLDNLMEIKISEDELIGNDLYASDIYFHRVINDMIEKREKTKILSLKTRYNEYRWSVLGIFGSKDQIKERLAIYIKYND
jgi:hypothetical protein